jgi:MYXO-CTERM domain-containing protein
MDGIGTGAQMDFASGATQSLHVKNVGQGPLHLAVAGQPPGITAAPLNLEPGAEGDFKVTITDGALASGSATLTLDTNDPDRKQVSIELGLANGGTDPGSPELPDASEPGGCSTGSGQGAGMLLLVLGLVALPRRRRR